MNKNLDESIDNHCKEIFEEDNINLIELIYKIFNNRILIIKFCIFFFLIGILISISKPNIYTATCKLLPQSENSSSTQGLSGLAAIAGISFNNSSFGELLSPNIYPKIISNVEFQKELINSKFNFSGFKDSISILEYSKYNSNQKFSFLSKIKKYSIGLPSLLFKSKKSQDVLVDKHEYSYHVINNEERNAIEIIKKNISLDVDKKDGIIQLSVEMTEPIVAVEIAQKCIDLLQKYITEFKTERVLSNLEFIELSLSEAQNNFEHKQLELANFRDSNKNISTSIAKTKEEKLMSEYNLLFSIYSELSKQREQAKISVKESTPIFTIIEPLVLPSSKSKPNRTYLTLSIMFLGLIISLILIISDYFIVNNLNGKTLNNKLFLNIK